jgi:ribonuclease III
MRSKGIKAESNERLEFLGDAVLQLVISEYLYSNYSKYREGALTKMRQQLVCEKTLAKIAKKIELGKYINLGNGEEASDCRSRPKILADSLEALIAAIYLDSVKSGNEEYKSIILKLFDTEIKKSSQAGADYKTKLQQLAEQDGTAILEYRIISEDGPEHTVQPGMVYISFSSEVGTIYSLAGLKAIRQVCDLYGLPLFIDGARMGYGLASEGCDVTLAEIASVADVFYLGGTKQGALFGEAVVIVNDALKKDFRYFIKQNGVCWQRADFWASSS